MGYQVLSPELVEYLLLGEVDELSDLNDARQQKIRAMPCPRCGAALTPRLNMRQTFDAHSPLPRMLATCECGVEIDPDSGLVIDRGKATKVVDPLPIIRPQEQ